MEFRASKSLVGQARMGMYGGVLAGAVISALFNGFNTTFLLTAGIPLALVLAVDCLVLSKAPKVGDVLVSLKLGSIDAHLFNTKKKSYPWSEVVGAKVESMGGAMTLQLQLKPSTDRPDKRAFLNGVNPARPCLPLQALTPADQELLLDAVLARLQEEPADRWRSAPLPQTPNDLTLARQLEERLTAMAPTVWVCWALIATNVLIWFATASQGVGWMTGDADKLYEFGGNAASAVQSGAWWRLLTSMFLHANAMHLLFNMVGLYVVGGMVERIFGRVPFLLIYLVSGLAGSVASLYFAAQKSVSVGASGAVFGIAGALLVVVYRHRESLPRLFNRQILSGMAVFVGYSLLMGFSKAGVDNAAHVGGLVAGALLGLLLPARFDAEHHARVVVGRAILAVGLLGAALAWAAFRAPTAQVDMEARIEARRTIPIVALAFDQAVKAMQQDVTDVKNGRMTDREADDRSRSVHAPRMKAVVDQLKALPVDAGSPASDVVADLQGLAQALYEMSAMESVEIDGKMQPADTLRAKRLEADFKHFNDRMQERMRRQKNASASRGG